MIKQIIRPVIIFITVIQLEAQTIKEFDDNILINGDFHPGIENISPAYWQSGSMKSAFISGDATHAAGFVFSKNQGTSVTPSENKFSMRQYPYLCPIGIDKCKIGGKVKIENGKKIVIMLSAYMEDPWGVDQGLPLRKGKKIAIKSLTPSPGWQEFSIEAEIPHGTVSTLLQIISDNCNKFSVSDFSIKPIYKKIPNASVYFCSQKKRIKLERIFISENSLFNEKLAAVVFKQFINRLSGAIIPIYFMPEKLTHDLRKGSFFIGRAAVESNVIPKEEMSKAKLGSYVIKVNDSCGAISGSNYSIGNLAGISWFIKKLGCRFYTCSDYDIPEINTSLELQPLKIIGSPSFKYTIPQGWPVMTSTAYLFGYSCYVDFIASAADMDMNVCMSGYIHNPNYFVNYQKYHKDHPEYFSLHRGKRIKLIKRYHCIHLCMSNPDVQKIAIQRMCEWIKAQPQCKIFLVGTGDGGKLYCDCEKCRSWDSVPGGISKTDRYLRFINIIANAIAKKYPDKIIMGLSYAKWTEDPPVNIKPASNVHMMYCLWPSDWPCHDHAFCEKNREGMDNLKKWLDIMPGRVHIFDYPWNSKVDCKRLKYFNSENIYGVLHCGFRGTMPRMNFYLEGLMNWNIHTDIDHEVKNFMNAYYGKKSAPYMYKYYKSLNFIMKENFTHHKNGSALFPFQHTLKSYLTADFTDKACNILNKAISAAKNNNKYIRRIKLEKCNLLKNELNQRNKLTGFSNDEEAKKFAKQLTEFIEMAKELNARYIFYKTYPSTWLNKVARLNISSKYKKHWKDSPAVNAFMANPEKVIMTKFKRQEKIPGGWNISALNFKDGEGPGEYKNNCPLKTCMIIRRLSSGNNRTGVVLNIDDNIDSPKTLIIEGLDDDKPGKSLMEIYLNDKKIFSGKNSFAEKNWTEMKFKITEGLLRKGKNKICVINITPDKKDETTTNDVSIMATASQKDYRWGWIAVSNIKIIRQKDKNQ